MSNYTKPSIVVFCRIKMLSRICYATVVPLLRTTVRSYADIPIYRFP